MLDHRQEERIRADERARVENELHQLTLPQNGVHADQQVTSDDRIDAVPDARVDADDRPGMDQTVERRVEPETLAVPATTARAATVDADEWSADDQLPVVERTVVSEAPIEVVRVRKFSLGQLMSMLAGLALLAFGVTAMVTTGVRTPWDSPVESVFGWNHTPLLGILETAAGALLVVFSLRPGGRWVVGIVGLALIVGGVMILNELSWATDRLGAERNFGWAPIAVGGVAVLASLLTPRRYQYMTGVPVEALAPQSTRPEPARRAHA